MSGNEYLAEYDRAIPADLSRGIGGYLRARLDAKARALGQRDRHALFLPRALEVCGMRTEQPLTIMEIGCGNGGAISYKHPSIRYVAVDIGPYFRDALEQDGIEFIEANVEHDKITRPDGSVDLIMLNHLIEHVSNSDGLVRELRRLIKPGGAVYIRTPNVERVKWRFFDDYTHIKPFTVNGLHQLMCAHGFERRCVLYSDHARINLDILTNGKFRDVMCGQMFGGKEIEAVYVRKAS